MKLTFYGGASEVGRLCILLEDNQKNLLMDCGIKLGEQTEYPLLDQESLKKIRNITISHAHMDHCGYLPHIYNKGGRPKVFLTKPTRDLMGVLLADYQRIQKEKAEKPLFTTKDVNLAMQEAKIVEYDEQFSADFKVTFRPAGHILGSALTLVEHENRRILFSGDICMRKTRILDPCIRDLSADTLLVESTYGSKTDLIPSYRESYAKMVNIINQTLKGGGHVLIPSFAVGRAQEVLLALDDYMRSGIIIQAKIYVDGMIGKAMKIYRHNAYYANDDIKKRILMSEDDPFHSPNFHTPKSKTKEDVLSEPSIIVTTSGMLSGGPVLQYLPKLANNPKNTIIFVGYQAEGTNGEKILSGAKTISIDGQEIELNMRIERVRLSGHADFNELLQFIKGIKGLKKIFLMHGEKGDLVEALEKDYEIVRPKLLESYEI